MTGRPASFNAAHRVPSASAHVGLSILHIDGPEYAIARSEQLRISFNIGAGFATQISGSEDDGVLFCRRNGLMITPPGVALHHRSTYVSTLERAPKPARLVVFVLSIDLLAECCIERGIRYSDLSLSHRSIPPSAALVSLSQALLADLSEGSPDGAAETEYLAKALVARVARQRAPQLQTVHAEDPLRMVQTHIDSNLGSALPISELAEIAGMSRFHFCRVFRNATGRSPHQYILAARIQAACRMLWGASQSVPGADSILAIALACGFGSSSHFSTQFKRHMGQSPLQWRASQR